MAQVSFYQLTKTNLEEALPKLLEKVLETNGRAVVLCDSEEKAKTIDTVLWMVGGTRFIPHGTAKDELPEMQPVYITTGEENPNKSNFLILLSQNETEYFNQFERTLFVFSGASESELAQARGFWKKLKANNDNQLKYFQQNDKGAWEEKNG